MKNIFLSTSSHLWAWYLRHRGAQVGKNFSVNGKISFLLRNNAKFSNLVIGDNVTFNGPIYIRIRKNGSIILGDGVTAGPEVWLVAANNCTLAAGSNSILGSYNILNGGHGITIGENCLFAAFVYVNTSDHSFQKGKLIQEQGYFGAPIKIGTDVWLGGHCFINKGVNINSGAVVGSGSIVTHDVPENAIVGGNPAKIIKYRK